MAMVTTMKKMATARHEAEQPPRSLVKFWKLPLPPPSPPDLTERRVVRPGPEPEPARVPDMAFN